jgi:hypothetical protein
VAQGLEPTLRNTLLVDGDPLENIKLVEDPAMNLVHQEGRETLQEQRRALRGSMTLSFAGAGS